LKPPITEPVSLSEASPPARGRGLKLMYYDYGTEFEEVAPRTGAWIETGKSRMKSVPAARRPPHGGVD